MEGSMKRYNGQKIRELEKMRENRALVISDQMIIADYFPKLKKTSNPIFKKNHEPQERLKKIKSHPDASQ